MTKLQGIKFSPELDGSDLNDNLATIDYYVKECQDAARRLAR